MTTFTPPKVGLPRTLHAGPKGAVAPIRGPDLSLTVTCPYCPQTEIIEDFSAGDLICGGCGVILGDRIVDTRSEWRTFAGDEGDDPSRVGAASSGFDGPETFETSISFRDGNSGLSRELQRASSKAMTTKDVSLTEAYQEISAYCQRISLGQVVIDSAKQIYQLAHRAGLVRSKTQTEFIGACIFIACRRTHSDRTFKEIQNLTSVPKKLLAKAFKILQQQLLGNALTSSNSGPPPPPQANAISDGRNASDPSVISSSAFALAQSTSDVKVIDSLLPRYLSNLGLRTVPGFMGACTHVLIGAKALDLIDGRSPLTVLGSLVLFVAKLWNVDKSAREIAEAVQITEGTIRARCRVMEGKKALLIKKEWIDEGKVKLD